VVITTVSIKATNGCGSATCSFMVTVKDIQLPVINGIAKPIVLLWSPNHSYQTISASQFITSVTDNCCSIPVANVFITKVTNDELEDASGDADGNTLNDVVIAANCKWVQLRSERVGGGNGRVYTIYIAVKDLNGNTGTATFKVWVASSQNGTTAIDNIKPLYTVNSSCSGIVSRAVTIIPKSNENSGVPTMQSYPNPFSSSATIHYVLPNDAHISLAVYNQLGQKVAQLQEGRSAGSHYQKLDGTKLAAGFYICRLVTGNEEGKLIQLNEKLVIAK
jgi:Secretion system C-terminal sorting domain